MSLDSRIDTYEHIAQVRGFIDTCVIELLRRGLIHDASKLETPEKEAYDGLGEDVEISAHDRTIEVHVPGRA